MRTEIWSSEPSGCSRARIKCVSEINVRVNLLPEEITNAKQRAQKPEEMRIIYFRLLGATNFSL